MLNEVFRKKSNKGQSFTEMAMPKKFGVITYLNDILISVLSDEMAKRNK